MLKMGITPKIFRVMPLALQLHLVMMSKFSKFGVDIFNIFLVMGYIKVFARRRQRQQRRRSSDHNSSNYKLKIKIIGCDTEAFL